MCPSAPTQIRLGGIFFLRFSTKDELGEGVQTHQRPKNLKVHILLMTNIFLIINEEDLNPWRTDL